MLPSIINGIIWGHTEVCWCFVSISSFAEGVIVHYLESNHMWLKSSSNLHKVCWQFLAKWSSAKRELVPLQHTCQPKLALNWCHMTCDMASSHALCLLAWHVINPPVFCAGTQTQQFTVLMLGNVHSWGHWKIFGWSSHLLVSAFVASTSVYLLPQQWTLLLNCNYLFSWHS
jgi:hypothetical protein